MNNYAIIKFQCEPQNIFIGNTNNINILMRKLTTKRIIRIIKTGCAYDAKHPLIIKYLFIRSMFFLSTEC